ncbi:hypothetical protein VD0002_g420 [Verticillium dahliae]|uniref:Uncharacterized protein n=1 Tax=Verticillium dahliae TaxID=27337 RepID=A0AA44WDJ6_VERDA|nr:hypothetical protein BJF96_g7073 [Verticillium dahliae]PNH38799.1 hypothetical protein VD0004_g8040 [Verticillium dahliae]PNH56924.1 hypothetical protein VD0003_g887 [Verticillium dahliae]PNH67065.1 hypothetical protein VD0001_g7939 [Verticillium dahliae]PNH70144.1 hypothetical protein VD0002_g420 [Verticillium dahliae]
MVLRLLNPSMLHGIALGITRPLNASVSYSDLSRRASRDPSCPDGFLCSQTTCGGNVVCPGDRTCVDFEGTVGCAVPGLSWCAPNPITFEAVGCDGSVCCHGNCYVSGAICCDYESVKCVLGELCNVCSPGEKCNKGGCVGGSGEVKSSTTRATTSATTPVTATDREITTSTSSTTSIASVPTTTTLTLPTLVPRIDNFVNKGCFYVANLKRRVLRADSTVDASNTGMTVSKCIEFARNNNWQYAGVEFGR